MNATDKIFNPRPRRAMALVLVTLIIALATVVGLAMLQSASLQAQVGGSSSAIATADALAESGVNLAAYYLQNPAQAPTLNSSGYWPGSATSIPLNISTTGTLDSVTVSYVSAPTSTTARYQITAAASAPVAGAGSQRVSRTSKANILVTSKYAPVHALAANGNLTVGALMTTHVVGSMRVDGSYTNYSAVDLSGSLMTPTGGTSTPPQYPTKAAPQFSELSIVTSRPSYYYQGKLCTAEALTSNLASGTLQSSSSSNPANVWYSTSSRTLGSVTVPGTLMVLGTTSNLKINGNTRITPKSGMPGLIVQKDLQFSGASRALRVDGVTWIGGDITTDGLTASATIQVYGALMFGSANATFGSPLLTATATVSFDSTNANNLAADFGTLNQTPQNIKFESWSQ